MRCGRVLGVVLPEHHQTAGTNEPFRNEIGSRAGDVDVAVVQETGSGLFRSLCDVSEKGLSGSGSVDQGLDIRGAEQDSPARLRVVCQVVSKGLAWEILGWEHGHESPSVMNRCVERAGD